MRFRELGKTGLKVSETADCIGCRGCESRCPFHVPIAERMQKTKELFS